jgi:GT2 family glycosyltransferase
VEPPRAAAGDLGAAAGVLVPELSIVLATLDAACDPCHGCLRAIRENTEERHEVAILDNGGCPRGYTRPVNQAIRATIAPYLVLLNDDALVEAGWWPPLRSALDGGATLAFPRESNGEDWDDGRFNSWCFALTRESMLCYSWHTDRFLSEDYLVNLADNALVERVDRSGGSRVVADASRVRHLSRRSTARPENRPWVDEWMNRDHELAGQRRAEGAML